MHSTCVEGCEAFVDTLTSRYQCNPTELIQIVREIQDRFCHVSDAAIEALASRLSLPRSRIISVVEFYSFLHRRPRGRYDVLFSDSISDHLLGKQTLMDALCKKLGIRTGVTREDGQVSVDNTSCTGLCDQGPAGLGQPQPVGDRRQFHPLLRPRELRLLYAMPVRAPSGRARRELYQPCHESCRVRSGRSP